MRHVAVMWGELYSMRKSLISDLGDVHLVAVIVLMCRTKIPSFNATGCSRFTIGRCFIDQCISNWRGNWGVVEVKRSI